MSKEQIEELQKNPYFDKYAEKIAKLQKTSPEEFLTRLAEKEATKESLSLKSKDFFLPTAPKPSVTDPSDRQEKTLEKIMKTELLKDKTPEEISAIWSEHWSSKGPTEARCLADQVELYYSRPTPSKLELLEKFTNQPAYFQHMDLIEEMNNLALGDKQAASGSGD